MPICLAYSSAIDHHRLLMKGDVFPLPSRSKKKKHWDLGSYFPVKEIWNAPSFGYVECLRMLPLTKHAQSKTMAFFGSVWV